MSVEVEIVFGLLAFAFECAVLVLKCMLENISLLLGTSHKYYLCITFSSN